MNNTAFGRRRVMYLRLRLPSCQLLRFVTDYSFSHLLHFLWLNPQFRILLKDDWFLNYNSKVKQKHAGLNHSLHSSFYSS